MIYKLLNLTRPLIIVDSETTGLDTAKDRVVELAAQTWTADGLAKEWRTLVNPCQPISPAATKTHSITDAMVNACRKCGGLRGGSCACPEFKPWPTFAQIAAPLAKEFSACDFAGQNVRYDLRILSAEFARAGVAWSYAGARVVDAGRLEALLHPRDLSTLYEQYTGQKLEGAHGALADVKAATAVIEAQMRQVDLADQPTCTCAWNVPGTHFNACPLSQPRVAGKFALPSDLDALHELQWPNFCDAEGKFRFNDGVPVIMFGKHQGKAMRDIPVDYYDWLLKSDFSPDVKRLAADAKLGRFPVQKRKA